MPGRFPGARPNFAGRDWCWQLGQELNEHINSLWDGMVNLQGQSETPTTVEGGAEASIGVLPAPALSDHQHPLNVAGAPGNVTAAASVQGGGPGVSLSGHTHGLDDASVLYAKIQDVSAASRLLGRGSAAGAGDVQELTLALGLALVGTVLSILPVVLRPAQVTANQNDYAPGTLGTFWTHAFVNTDAARNFTGILASGIADGVTIRWVNNGTQNEVLQHENVGSTAANRLLCPGAVDLTLAAAEAVDIVRDATAARWRVFRL